MRNWTFYYIVSLLLLTTMSMKTCAYFLNYFITTSTVEFVDNNSIEKDGKEIEKQFEKEVEICIQQDQTLLFAGISKNLEYTDRKIKLPFIHYQLHCPPPNYIV